MELWDVYDRSRRPLHRTHVRGRHMAKGEYHVVVFAWIVNSSGELLLTRRDPAKESFPNLWAVTGGSAIAGESSRQAIRREVFEETGIVAREEEFEFVTTFMRGNSFSDTYLLHKDVPREHLVMQEGETCDARWVSRRELRELMAAGEVAQPDIRRFRQLEKLLGVFLR